MTHRTEQIGRWVMRTATSFAVAVVLISACVVTYSQYQRAVLAEDAVASLTRDLNQANTDLQMSEVGLTTTQSTLADLEQALQDTREAAAREQDESRKQLWACRYLVHVNDHMLYAMNAQSAATGRVLDGKNRAAHRSIQRAQRHVRAIRALVKRGKFGNLDRMIRVCAPPRQR